jgi:transposase
MHVEHKAGDKLFVDYAGEKLQLVDPHTGEVKQVEVFVAILGVMKNGHVCLGTDKHYYSVPYRFIGKKVKLLYSNSTVEVFYNYERIAFHQRFKSQYNYTTLPEHLASTHRFVTEWTPERFLNWAAGIDEQVRQYIYTILERKQHVEQAYKACLGILSMAKKYGNQRLTIACKRGMDYDMYSYKAIDMILKRGLDKEEPQIELFTPQMPEHDNIRGKSYFQ